MMMEASVTFGIEVELPDWIEIPSQLASEPDGKGYLEPIQNDIKENTLFALVLISDPMHKKAIKKLLDKGGIPS